MSKDPAFLFYDGDASRDVSHMSRLQRGAYFDFIQAQRKFCSKNDNNTTVLPKGIPLETIKSILGQDFDACWPSLKLIMLEKEGYYYISWLKESIDCREAFCDRQRNNVNVRWNNRGNTMVIPPEDENKDVIKDINSKKEDKKGKGKKFIPPSMEEVIKYFTDNGYSKDLAERFFKGYADADPPWTDTKGNKMRSWKQKAQQVWFRPEQKTNISSETEEHIPITPWEKYCEKNSEPGVMVFDRMGTLFGLDKVHSPVGKWPSNIYDGCAKEIFEFMIKADKTRNVDNLKKVNDICDRWKAKINVKP